MNGDLGYGCELSLTAIDYTIYDDIRLNFDNTFTEDMPYAVFVNENKIGDFITDDGDYIITLTDFTESSTVRIEGYIPPTEEGTSSNTPPSNDEIDRDGELSDDGTTGEFLDLTVRELSFDEVPQDLKTTISEVIQQPINWLVIIASYIGAFVISFINKDDDENELSSTMLFGTIGWIIPLLALVIGLNPFLFNYLASTGSFLVGFINFSLYGAVIVWLVNMTDSMPQK